MTFDKNFLILTLHKNSKFCHKAQSATRVFTVTLSLSGKYLDSSSKRTTRTETTRHHKAKYLMYKD